MLGVYNYTVVLTYFGMLSAFAGLACAERGDLRGALLCLMLAGVCDMFDGKIASTKTRTRQEKRFGVQIDSLSDLVCFGVLPARIVCRLAGSGPLGFYAGGFYLLCALIRLAWFNVIEEEHQDRESGSRKEYRGLPVTTAALLLPLTVGLCRSWGWPLDKVTPVLLLLMAAAFLTPFPIKKPALPGKLAVLLCGGAGLWIVLMGVGP